MVASVFVSHGSPALLIEANSPARAFLAGLGKQIGHPKAIVVITAHWETARPTVSATAHPTTIHDFHGFPDTLYQMRYPANGSPTVAVRVAQLTGAALDTERGLDHGAWVPLMLMYPNADVPVVQLSVQPDAGPRAHLELGRKLRPLAGDGVLVLGSGGAVHNLSALRYGSDQPEPWARDFDEWMVSAVQNGDAEAVANYREQTLHGRLAHPRDEHLLPLLVAFGAGGGPGFVLHRGFEHGSLSMAAFGWDRLPTDPAA